MLVEVFPNTVKNTSSSVKQVSEGVTRSVKILRKAVLIPDKHRPKPDSKFPSTNYFSNYEQYQFLQDGFRRNMKMDTSRNGKIKMLK